MIRQGQLLQYVRKPQEIQEPAKTTKPKADVLLISALHGREESEEKYGFGLYDKKRKGKCLREVCTIDIAGIRRKKIAKIKFGAEDLAQV